MLKKLLNKYHIYWFRLVSGMALYPASWLFLYFAYWASERSINSTTLPPAVKSIMLTSAHAEFVLYAWMLQIMLVVWTPAIVWASYDLRKDHEYYKMLKNKKKSGEWKYEHDE